MGVIGATWQCILIICLHLLFIIIVQVIFRIGILAESRVLVDVIRVKDRGLLGPVKIYQSSCSIHAVFSLLRSATR